jgi:hypothetical protein
LRGLQRQQDLPCPLPWLTALLLFVELFEFVLREPCAPELMTYWFTNKTKSGQLNLNIAVLLLLGFIDKIRKGLSKLPAGALLITPC